MHIIGRMAETTTYADAHAYDNLWHSVWHKTYTVFGVKQCQGAMIALSEVYGITDNSYEIVIGGSDNLLVVIRSSIAGDDKASISASDLLHCDETRYFWVGIYCHQLYY